MKKTVYGLICLLIFFTTGCVKAPVVIKYAKYEAAEFPTIRLEAEEEATAWWGPVKTNLKKKLIETIKTELKKYPIIFVDLNPDIVLTIKDIKTTSEKKNVWIEEVVVTASAGESQIFKIVCKPQPLRFSEQIGRSWRLSRGSDQVGVIVARKIIEELGISWDK